MYSRINNIELRLFGALSLVVITPSLTGCGGASGGQTAANQQNLPQKSVYATVQIAVNMLSRTVTYTPVNSGPAGRAVFGGSSVAVSGPTTLSAATGDPSVQALSITVTNNYGVGIGVLPNGTATGLSAVLNSITSTPSGTTESVQLSNKDGIVPQSGAGQNLPYLSYGPIAAGGNQTRAWNFIVPSTITNFTLSIVVEGATADETPPQAASGAGSGSTLVRTILSSVQPLCIAVDAAGNTYFAESGDIRRISAAGVKSLVAGSPTITGLVNGPGNLARFTNMFGICVSPAGNVIYVTDRVNGMVRSVALAAGADPTNAANWTVNTIGGGGTQAISTVAAPATSIAFTSLNGIALDASGNLDIADGAGANRVDEMQFTGGDPSNPINWQAVLVAGSPTGGSGFVDQNGTLATFNDPTGIAADPIGNIYVADRLNGTIRRITPSGEVTTIAGKAGISSYLDSTIGIDARLNLPFGCALDSAGYLYFTDGSTRVRRVNITSASFPVETVAGTANPGDVDGTGNSAEFNGDIGVAVDASGDIYVADIGNRAIRLIQRALP